MRSFTERSSVWRVSTASQLISRWGRSPPAMRRSRRPTCSALIRRSSPRVPMSTPTRSMEPFCPWSWRSLTRTTRRPSVSTNLLVEDVAAEPDLLGLGGVRFQIVGGDGEGDLPVLVGADHAPVDGGWRRVTAQRERDDHGIGIAHADDQVTDLADSSGGRRPIGAQEMTEEDHRCDAMGARRAHDNLRDCTSGMRDPHYANRVVNLTGEASPSLPRSGLPGPPHHRAEEWTTEAAGRRRRHRRPVLSCDEEVAARAEVDVPLPVDAHAGHPVGACGLGDFEKGNRCSVTRGHRAAVHAGGGLAHDRHLRWSDGPCRWSPSRRRRAAR